jgi:hypothetical protein
MRVVVRGWSRDRGETEIMNTRLASMPAAPDNVSYKKEEACLQVVKIGHLTKVHVWAGADLNLNGSYQTHLELDRHDIGRLFYLAYGDRGLDEIGRLIADYKDREEERAAAITVSKEDARKAIVAQWQRLPAAERADIAQACQFVNESMKRYSWRVTGGAYEEAVDWIEPYVGKP